MFKKEDEGFQILSVFRLGRIASGQCSNPRPMEVILDNADACKRMLSRTHFLKGWPFRLLRDLSPEERNKMREAVRELRSRREAGEEDIHIVDFRVVKRRKKAFRNPVTLLPSH